MSNEARTEQAPTGTRVIDLVQRGTDRFHDQQAEARRVARAASSPGS